MNIVLTEFIRGRQYRLFLVGSDTQNPAYDFLTHLAQTHANEHAKLLARLRLVADNGPPRNPEQSRQLKGAGPVVLEFKTHKLRLFWFYDENRVILCTNGIVKGTTKAQNQAIATARQWKTDYSDAKQAKTLKIHPLP